MIAIGMILVTIGVVLAFISCGMPYLGFCPSPVAEERYGLGIKFMVIGLPVVLLGIYFPTRITKNDNS